MGDRLRHIGTLLFVVLATAPTIVYSVWESKREKQLEAFSLKGDFEAQLLEAVLSNTVYVGFDGTILNATHGAATLFGYSVSELKGTSITELMSPEFRPRHNNRFTERLKLAVDTKKITEVKCDGVRKDKTTFPIEIRVREADTQQGRILIGRVTPLDSIVTIPASK